MTYGHADNDEAALLRGRLPHQTSGPKRRAHPLSCVVKTRVLPRLASTPAPRSTSLVTTRRSGAVRPGTVTTYRSSKKAARRSSGRKAAQAATSESCWPSAYSSPGEGVTLLDMHLLRHLVHSFLVVPPQVSGGARRHGVGKGQERRDERSCRSVRGAVHGLRIMAVSSFADAASYP